MVTTMSSPPSVVVDACVVIALCAKEPDKYATAQSQIVAYATAGSKFFAPGVLIAECLFVLCKKLEKGELTALEHSNAVVALVQFMQAIDPPPSGDRMLVKRAEEMRGTLSARRSADGIYLALAEQLAAADVTEIVTFDSGLSSQAAANSLTARVVLLPSVPLHASPLSTVPPTSAT